MIRRPLMAFLVADGGRAQLLLRHSNGAYDVLETFEAEEHPRLPRADGRTRVFSSAGEGRSAVEPDPQSVADRRNGRFAVRLAQAVSGAFDQGRFGSFAVLAPARMLRPIREALAPHACHHLGREIACDLTKLPKAALHARLDKVAASLPEHAA